MKYIDTLNYTQSKKSMIYPNYGFRQQLKMFEKLLIDNNYDIDKINFKEIKWEFTKDMQNN